MKNGSELQKRNKSFVLTNSCAFDSIASVYGTLYIDHSTVRNQIDNSSSEFATFIKSFSQKKEIDSKIEFLRFNFLKEVYPNNRAIKEMKNFVQMNCKTAVSGLFSSMFNNNVDILSSRQQISKCSNCGIENIIESPFLNSNIENFDYKNVQKSIFSQKTRVCDTCVKEKMEINEKFHEIVAIDCESLRKSEQKMTSINDIEKQIVLDENEYQLFAAIQFNPHLQHFIAHVKRKINIWETYDDLNRTIIDTDINENLFVFMLFYKRISKGNSYNFTKEMK